MLPLPLSQSIGVVIFENVELECLHVHTSFVQKTIWVPVLTGFADETDYDNFKSEVANHQGVAGAAYEHSLHEVWSVMNRLQK